MSTQNEDQSKISCIIIDDDEMSRTSLTHLIEHAGNLNLLKSFSNPVEAVKFLQEHKPEIIFLDIEMPEMSGLEMLRDLSLKTNVILITSKTQYAYDAFEYNVVDYLLKPITLSRFMNAIKRVKTSADNIMVGSSNNDQDYFFIKKGPILDKVPVKDILWIEALGDYVTVHTLDKKYILHLTMKNVENKLPPKTFVRVHRSFIVHINNIKVIEDTSIYITNVPIPIGAMYKESFVNKLNLLA